MEGRDNNTQKDISALFQEAGIYFQQGCFAEAKTRIKKILEVSPGHADANHLLGLIAGQNGDYVSAARLINHAISSCPRESLYHYNLGCAWQAGGQPQKALAAFDRTIRLNPNLVDAHNNRGNMLRDLGRPEEALVAYKRALQLNPNLAGPYYNHGTVLLDLGNPEEALAACDRAVQLNPAYAEAHYSCGKALMSLGRLEEALVAYGQAIMHKPNYVEAYCNQGVVLRDLGRLEDALEASERAVELNQEHVIAQANLGVILSELGRLEDALTAYEMANRLQPDYAEAHNNRGNTLRDLGRLGEALAAFRKAIKLQPEYAEAHNNYAMLLLLSGNFHQGWREYEWRCKTKAYFSSLRHHNVPRWDGGPLRGKTILLYAEQGFGDTLQFIRYVPFVAKAGGHVVVECQSAQMCLLSDIPGIDRLIAKGDPLLDFDVHISLLSLPYILGTTLDSIPATIPYLHAPLLPASLRDQFGFTQGKRNIGIVWAGNPGHKNDRSRSVELTRFGSLLNIPGIQWYSLQVGERAADLGKTEGFEAVIDVSPCIGEFSDTAAVIAELDLVISVDTAVVHLAGALGAPVWVLLPFMPDWRWLLEREDSPWYPGMRLNPPPLLMGGLTMQFDVPSVPK